MISIFRFRFKHAPKNTNSSRRKWYEPVAEFGGHLFAGLLIFTMMTSAAVGIWWVITELKHYNVDPIIILALQAVEYVLLGLDVVIFMAWVVTAAVSAYNSLRENLRQ